MSTESLPRQRRRRPVPLAFAAGFAVAWVATMLALVFPLFERLEPLLVPAAVVLRPVSDAFADWPGLLSMLVAGTVNGLVYAAVAWLVVLAMRGVRGRSGGAAAGQR